MNMTRLKELSFVLENGTVISHHGKPGSNEPGPDEVFNEYSITPKFNGCYTVKNSTVVFVEAYTVYVTTLSFVAINVLEAAGFIYQEFDIPLEGEGDSYPKDKKYQWDSLVISNRNVVCDQYEAACQEFCTRKGIEPLDADLLERRCLKIDKGIPYRKLYYTGTTGPQVSEFGDPLAVRKFLGTYWVNNGKVTFVHTDGRTYVARAKYAVEALIDAGFHEEAQYVHFSNGEEILDERIAEIWGYKCL